MEFALIEPDKVEPIIEPDKVEPIRARLLGTRVRLLGIHRGGSLEVEGHYVP